jgi:hypothetical protein
VNEIYPQLVGKSMFLGIGAQKSGTTWLSGYLAGHPEVYMSALKEMHFWGNRSSDAKWPNSAFKKRLGRLQSNGSKSVSTFNHISALEDRLKMNGDIGKYAEYFNSRIEKQHAFGEISPAYCKLHSNEFEFIKGHFPDIKIIFLMRNPVDRLWSQIRFSEPVDTLEEMEQKIESAFLKSVYVERSDYVSTLRNIRRIFAPENIHFEFFEDLFQQRAMDGICRFLGVDLHAGEFSKKRNVSIKMPLHPRLRVSMVKRLEHQYTYVRDLFGGDIPNKWHTDIFSLRDIA